MKVGDNSFYSKSSFLSIEKDFALITHKMLKNEKLKKLLFYQTADCLDKPNLTKQETLSLINKQIKIVPNKLFDAENYSFILITFNNFVTNGTNPEFRDNTITFDIVCHYDNWNLGNFQLRPYKIAGEIDALFNDTYLTGIGKLVFISGDNNPVDDEFGSLSLTYLAIHGEDDKIE